MSLQPGRHNLSVYKGATFRKMLTLHIGDKNSPVRDLTGFTARMPILAEDDTLLMNLTSENGGIVLGGTAGTIMLYMSDEATEAATWDLGEYRLFLTDSFGDTNLLLYGNFTIKNP